MPTVEDVRKSVGDTGSDGGGLLLQGPAGAGAALGQDGDVLLDYTERVQSFFPECKTSVADPNPVGSFLNSRVHAVINYSDLQHSGTTVLQIRWIRTITG